MSENSLTKRFLQILAIYLSRGIGTGLGGPATGGPKFPEPTIKNIILLFVIKQIRKLCITVTCL